MQESSASGMKLGSLLEGPALLHLRWLSVPIFDQPIHEQHHLKQRHTKDLEISMARTLYLAFILNKTLLKTSCQTIIILVGELDPPGFEFWQRAGAETCVEQLLGHTVMLKKGSHSALADGCAQLVNDRLGYPRHEATHCTSLLRTNGKSFGHRRCIAPVLTSANFGK